MKEMNSETHSCIHSLASFAILAFSGRAVFIILATGAKLCMLASESKRTLLFAALDCCGDDDRDCEGDEEDDCMAWLLLMVRASDSMVTTSGLFIDEHLRGDSCQREDDGPGSTSSCQVGLPHGCATMRYSVHRHISCKVCITWVRG